MVCPDLWNYIGDVHPFHTDFDGFSMFILNFSLAKDQWLDVRPSSGGRFFSTKCTPILSPGHIEVNNG